MKHLAFLSIFILLLGCKKKAIEFVIEGQVIDLSFNSAQTGGSLKLYKIPAGGGGEDLVSSTFPDAIGRYVFRFERDKSEKYIIRYEREGYYNEEKIVFFSALSTNEPFQLDFQTEAQSRINWIISNVEPNLSSDKVVIQKLNGRTDCKDCCDNTSYEYAGPTVKDTLSCVVNGNRYVRFYVVNLSENVYLDSVYCTAFGNVNYIVNF